jgi:hypothetical protein
MIIADISPGTNIEWLWTLDLVDLSWEILRYRCLKQKTLEAFRLAAVEALLQRVEGLGLSFSDGRYLQQAHQLFLSGSFFWHPPLAFAGYGAITNGRSWIEEQAARPKHAKIINTRIERFPQPNPAG